MTRIVSEAEGIVEVGCDFLGGPEALVVEVAFIDIAFVGLRRDCIEVRTS